MYQLNKIRGQIKLLEKQHLKLSRYLDEANAKTPVDPVRIKDITRALKRVTDNIQTWQNKIEAIENAPPRVMPRPPITDATGGTLIG